MSSNIAVVCCFISYYSLTNLVISNFLLSYAESTAIETTVAQYHTIHVETNHTNENVSLSEINKRQNNDSSQPKIENDAIPKLG